MAHPTRLLSLAVLSALLIPITQFAGSWQPLRAAQGEEAQSPLAPRGRQSQRLRLEDSYQWIGNLELSLAERSWSQGGRAGNQVSRQEPVLREANQIPGFFDRNTRPIWLPTTSKPKLLYTLETLRQTEGKSQLLDSVYPEIPRIEHLGIKSSEATASEQFRSEEKLKDLTVRVDLKSDEPGTLLQVEGSLEEGDDTLREESL
jgi:hypothetical protein